MFSLEWYWSLSGLKKIGNSRFNQSKRIDFYVQAQKYKPNKVICSRVDAKLAKLMSHLLLNKQALITGQVFTVVSEESRCTHDFLVHTFVSCFTSVKVWLFESGVTNFLWWTTPFIYRAGSPYDIYICIVHMTEVTFSVSQLKSFGSCTGWWILPAVSMIESYTVVCVLLFFFFSFVMTSPPASLYSPHSETHSRIFIQCWNQQFFENPKQSSTNSGCLSQWVFIYILQTSQKLTHLLILTPLNQIVLQ